MAIVRVEWTTIGVSPAFEGHATNIIKNLAGQALSIADVSSTVTAAETRPIAPSVSGLAAVGQYSRPYARVTAVSGNSIVAWGNDPIASQTNGILILEGSVEMIPVDPGQKLSFIQLA